MGYLVRRQRRAIAGMCMMVLGAGAVAGAFPDSAGATDGPERHDWGIRGCVDLGGVAKEFTIELSGGVLVEAAYSDAASGFAVEIANVKKHAHGQLTFDFSSNVDVEAVLAMAHPHGLPSLFDAPATIAGLVTTGAHGLPSRSHSVWASVQLEGSWSLSISHISFCWNDDHGTTPPSEPTTTTSSSSTTTTTTGSSTTSSPTTSIGQPSTTTTEPLPSTSASTTPPSTTPSGRSLPRTGANTGLLLAIGAGLLTGGTAILGATRASRRRRV